MRPGMPEGSVVVVTPMPANSVRIGDVITFAAPDDHRIVTHRVVQIVEAGDEPVVRTKGDANNAPDPWDAQLLGGTVWKKRFSIPKLGYGMVWLRNPKVLPLTLAFLPFLCLIAWIIEIWWNHEPEVSLPPMQLSYVAQDFLPHRR
jgi:signal peptidase